MYVCNINVVTFDEAGGNCSINSIAAIFIDKCNFVVRIATRRAKIGSYKQDRHDHRRAALLYWLTVCTSKY